MKFRNDRDNKYHQVNCDIIAVENDVITVSPIGWIIKLDNGFTLYHAGDTSIFFSMEILSELYPSQTFVGNFSPVTFLYEKL